MSRLPMCCTWRQRPVCSAGFSARRTVLRSRDVVPQTPIVANGESAASTWRCLAIALTSGSLSEERV